MKMKTNKRIQCMVANGLTPTCKRQRWEDFYEFKVSLIYTDFQASKTLTLKKKVDNLIGQQLKQ